MDGWVHKDWWCIDDIWMDGSMVNWLFGKNDTWRVSYKNWWVDRYKNWRVVVWTNAYEKEISDKYFTQNTELGIDGEKHSPCLR